MLGVSCLSDEKTIISQCLCCLWAWLNNGIVFSDRCGLLLLTAFQAEVFINKKSYNLKKIKAVCHFIPLKHGRERILCSNICNLLHVAFLRWVFLRERKCDSPIARGSAHACFVVLCFSQQWIRQKHEWIYWDLMNFDGDSTGAE